MLSIIMLFVSKLFGTILIVIMLIVVAPTKCNTVVVAIEA